jgi:hypothetical protein
VASDDVADDMAHNYVAVDLALAYVSTSPKNDDVNIVIC